VIWQPLCQTRARLEASFQNLRKIPRVVVSSWQLTSTTGLAFKKSKMDPDI
jgi:hypothetical protein